MDLVAPSAAWLGTFSPLLEMNPGDPMSVIADLPSDTLQRLGVEDVTLREFRRALRNLAGKPDGDPQRLEGEKLWRPAITKLRQQAEEVFDSAEARELEMALGTGSVTMISDGTRLEDNTEQQVAWFRDRLTLALRDPSSTVLLDQVTTDFLRESEEYVNGLPAVADSRFRRAAVGAGLVERLPTFPESPMSDVLEAREELAEGRAKYRTSVKELSGKLQSSALDATLPSEIDQMWHDDVRPRLEDLRKTVSKTRMAKDAGKRILTEGYGIPSILVAVASFSDLAAALPTPAAATAAAVRIAAAGAQEAFQARSAVRKHDLVYLLDLDKKLGKTR
ncbi:hypothetical protein [Paenarthrobacter aurescens]|uniref:hypothetical protein n=1 Tax=Paenarthrobacter aurescens TaxID=43663 RepID=UPI0018D3B415|nr:hypothetical protein [Paenarthrobacter aurescens]